MGQGIPEHNDGQRICADNGGFLPEPRSEQERNFLREFTQITFWLGAIRSSEGEYIWLSDGTKVVYTNWLSASDPHGTTHCVSRDDAANWVASPCTIQCDGDDRAYCNLVCQRSNCK